MMYLTEEEKCILRMYRSSDRIRTVADIIDALEETEEGPEEQLLRSTMDKITQMDEDYFRNTAKQTPMIDP